MLSVRTSSVFLAPLMSSVVCANAGAARRPKTVASNAVLYMSISLDGRGLLADAAVSAGSLAGIGPRENEPANVARRRLPRRAVQVSSLRCLDFAWPGLSVIPHRAPRSAVSALRVLT